MAYGDTGYLTILVIDDDDTLRELVTGALIAEGHQVVAVDSAEEGLAQLPYYTFEVAFLDHHLPGMEGLVLGEYLAHNNPRMEIALVTGSADERLERLTRKEGLQLIHKPFEIEQLLQVVDRARAGAQEQIDSGARQAAGGWQLDLAAHWEALPAYFDAPRVPRRIEELLAWKIRQALDDLRYGSGDADGERHRAAAYSGLLAAQVLGLHLPRHKDGHTLFERYDALMREHGKAPAFGTDRGSQ